MTSNMMELFVNEEIECLVKQPSYNGCTCSRCKADMMAYALNKLPTKYVVTYQGAAIAKVESTIPQNRADIIARVAEAAQVIAEYPRH